MATITIDDDLKAALKDGRITWDKAGELRDGRREAKRIRRQIDKREQELASLRQRLDALMKVERRALSEEGHDEAE